MSLRPPGQARLIRPDNIDLVVVEASPTNNQQGFLRFGGRSYQCALGRGGVIDAVTKKEGDGATPAGLFRFDTLYYRPDRLEAPATGLPTRPITPGLGWCDDPSDAGYNQAVTLPCTAGAEALWREDGVYDLLLTLSHNRDPARPGRGSAIFLHIAKSGPGQGQGPDMKPTRGCIAIQKANLIGIVAALGPASMIRIEPAFVVGP